MFIHYKTVFPKRYLIPVFPRKRLHSCFFKKDRTKFEHQHDTIYQVNCSVENCPDDYIGESARCIIERLKDHGGKDTKSHALKHSSEKEHVEVTQEDFKIIGSHFKNKLKNRLKNCSINVSKLILSH